MARAIRFTPRADMQAAIAVTSHHRHQIDRP
jgi:hypothetical protein